MSLIDKVWHWGHVMGGVGVILNDPMDTILQRLSVAYLDEAKAVITAELEPVLEQPPELVPVFFHPAKNNWFPDLDPTLVELGPFHGRYSPFGGVGWLVANADDDLLLHGERPELLPPVGRSVCVMLLQGRPSLSLCGGGRWARASTTATDSEAQLMSLLASNDDDVTDWFPIDPLPPEQSATVWAQAQAAAMRCDAVALRDHLAEAHHRYSPAGWRMLRSGVLELLAIQLAQGKDRS